MTDKRILSERIYEALIYEALIMEGYSDEVTQMLKEVDALESEVDDLKEQLGITARLGGEQARNAIHLNAQLIKAEANVNRLTEELKEARKTVDFLAEQATHVEKDREKDTRLINFHYNKRLDAEAKLAKAREIFKHVKNHDQPYYEWLNELESALGDVVAAGCGEPKRRDGKEDCGKYAPLYAPLTFCNECKHTKEADEIRKQYEEWFKKIVASRSALKALGGVAVEPKKEAEG